MSKRMLLPNTTNTPTVNSNPDKSANDDSDFDPYFEMKPRRQLSDDEKSSASVSQEAPNYPPFSKQEVLGQDRMAFTG